MPFWIAMALLGLYALGRTAVLVRADGLGTRPAPRSHAVETVGSTWPQQDRWDR